ncbi:MAG: hypothetical protein IPK08_15835 [Bacteroidetes bacterium]|nr:hypothetical protein [Bacteroidota bacterium]
MLHEYGHILHYQKLGAKEVVEIKDNDPDKWVTLSEFEAFKYQLSEIMEITKSTDTTILKDMMQRLEQRRLYNSDSRYRAALNMLFNEDIWKEALALIK